MTVTTEELLPDGDGKADWTESPAGTAFSRLNDSSDSTLITSATSGQICRVTLGTTMLSAGEYAVGCVFKIRANIPASNPLRVQLQHTATGSAVSMIDQNIGPTSGIEDIEIPCVAPITQAMLDGLQVNLSPTTSSGTVSVYRTSAVIHSSTDYWGAVNDDVIMANRDPETGLSIAAGFIAGDCFSPVDLNGTVVALMMRDSEIATAAGQQRVFGTYPGDTEPDHATFVRSAIGILSTKDAENATFTVTAGAGTTSYFPNTADGRVRWPQAAFIRNGRLFAVGMLETSQIRPTGRWVSYCDDFGDNPTDPSLWTWTHAATYAGGLSTVSVGAQGMYDNSATDGFVYLFDDGTLFTTKKATSIYRLPVAQFDDGTDWTGGEWWTGSGWSKDKPGFMTTLPPAIMGRKKPRGGTYAFAFGDGEGVNEGTIHLRGDSKFQLTGVMDAPWTWDGSAPTQEGTVPYHVGYSLTVDDTPGSKFQTPVTDKVQLTEIEDWCYFGARLPLTWTGQGANDQAWSYNRNTTRLNTFEASYVPIVVKATGVT